MTSLSYPFSYQHWLTNNCSRIKHSDVLLQLRSCLIDDDEYPTEPESGYNEYEIDLFFNTDDTISDDDSYAEDFKQQLEQVFIKDFDDTNDKLVTSPFGLISDEGLSESDLSDESSFPLDEKDLEIVNNITDDMKKELCFDANIVFHAEFARLISIPLLLTYHVRYYLFAEEELVYESDLDLNVSYRRIYNAKAHFKCSNTDCQYLWTSMRARILFSVILTNVGLLILKIFGQNCQHCGTYTNALWYTDEICRVMKNLTKSLFKTFYPDMNKTIDIGNKLRMKRKTKQSYDPAQRKGRMLAKHNEKYCEACQYGLCFEKKWQKDIQSYAQL